MALPGEKPIAVRVEERKGATALPVYLSSSNPPENPRSDNNQHQAESVHGKRRMDTDPVSKHTKKSRSARSAAPVNVELPLHVLISDDDCKESRACCIAVLRRDISKDEALLIREKITIISPSEKGEKTVTAQPVWHYFLHIIKWQPNLLLFNILLQSFYLRKNKSTNGIFKHKSSSHSSFTVNSTPLGPAVLYNFNSTLLNCF